MKTRTNGEGVPTLEELLDFAAATSLSEVVWEKDGRRIAFKRPAVSVGLPLTAEAPSLPAAPAEPKRFRVTSPMVGTFLRASKGRPPLVIEGDDVVPGQRLGVVEAMQVPRDVISSVKGRVLKVLVENGRPVEYGQPIFEIEPSEGA